MNAYLCAVQDSTVLAYAATAERAQTIAEAMAGSAVRRCDRVMELDSSSDNEAVIWPF
jgi:hypothetical protein